MRNHPWSTLARILLLLAALVVLVLILPRATANATPPMQKPVPHSIADHSDCLSCHATGVGGAPAVPADHQGRTNAMCTSCHQPGAAASTAATSPTPPTPSGPVGSPTSSAAAANSGISLDSWSSKDCQACHPREWNEWSRSGHAMTLSAQLLNSDHDSAEQLDQTCVKCHSPELGTTPIGNIVQPLDTKGPWHLVGQFANLGDMYSIPCLACHQAHGAKSSGLLPGMDFADESTFYRNVTAPQVSNLYIYDAFAQKHVDPQPIAPVMNGDQAIPINDTRANRVCYTCHATERAESNLFEPNTAPSGDNGVSSGDDRTLMGVHQGLQCVDCHMPGGSHTFNPMSSCSQCHSAGSTAGSLDYVTSVRTSYTDASLSMLSGNMSSLNIHWLDKSQIWPPVVVSMTATDTGDTVTYNISIRNNATWNMSNITVHGTIPPGSGYLDSWALNQNNPGKFLGTDVQLDIGSIASGQTFGPIVYRVLKGTAKDFTAHASVVWEQPMTGSAESPEVTIAK